ncbi:hypothetical protein SDC9_108443 [bioreactor metagenome]|uniref:Uncharacterized protein n=1 Tax=bioreactor metagenome TaxID=1076179 RepID=A0A645BEH3_9ZZZZ
MRQELQGAVNTRKNAAAVNVCDQKRCGLGMQRYTHVDDVLVPQVDFRNAARTFNHNGIVLSGKAVERVHYFVKKSVAPGLVEIFRCCLVAGGFTV